MHGQCKNIQSDAWIMALLRNQLGYCSPFGKLWIGDRFLYSLADECEDTQLPNWLNRTLESKCGYEDAKHFEI